MELSNECVIINTDEPNFGSCFGGNLTIEFNKSKTHNGSHFVKYDNRIPIDKSSHRTHYDNEKSYNNAIKRAQKQFKDFN